MKLRIENMPSCLVAYMRQIGQYGRRNEQLMKKFKGWLKANNLLNQKSSILGIAQDNPLLTAPQDCRYDTCLIVPQGFVTDREEVKTGHMSGGKYAVFKIAHTAEAVQKAWVEFPLVLDEQGLKHDETRLVLERYSLELVEEHYCELCVPIR
ncbi:GyrI-like domain-containing protein [Paenibacillus alvei]